MKISDIQIFDMIGITSRLYLHIRYDILILTLLLRYFYMVSIDEDYTPT